MYSVNKQARNEDSVTMWVVSIGREIFPRVQVRDKASEAEAF